MSDEAMVEEAFERFTPPFDPDEGNWPDVLARALPRRPSTARRWPPRRRTVLTVAAVVTALVPPVAWAFAHGIGGFGGWINGTAGQPASQAQLRAFTRFNDAAYARFSRGVNLRLLVNSAIAGQPVQLLGFRDGDSLCLLLARPGRRMRGLPQCTPTSELERLGFKAALAGSDGFWINQRQRLYAQAEFGLAADDVTGVDLVSAKGLRHAVVANNTFLRLTTIRFSPRWQPNDVSTNLVAHLEDGQSLRLPIFTPYTTQSQLRKQWPRPQELPGPSRLQAAPEPATIGWLERRETRGEPFQNQDRLTRNQGRIVFSRSIQPDPNSSFREGLTLSRVTNEAVTRPGARGQLWLCLYALLPGFPRDDLSSMCNEEDKFFNNGRAEEAAIVVDPLATYELEFPLVAGLVSDSVASLRLYLKDGQSLPVPVRDNAFARQVWAGSLPGKLVAANAKGQVIGIRVIPRTGFVALSG